MRPRAYYQVFPNGDLNLMRLLKQLIIWSKKIPWFKIVDYVNDFYRLCANIFYLFCHYPHFK